MCAVCPYSVSSRMSVCACAYARYTITPKAARHFADMSRRLYRVFAHTFYHHRALWTQIEVSHTRSETSPTATHVANMHREGGTAQLQLRSLLSAVAHAVCLSVCCVCVFCRAGSHAPDQALRAVQLEVRADDAQPARAADRRHGMSAGREPVFLHRPRCSSRLPLAFRPQRSG